MHYALLQMNFLLFIILIKVTCGILEIGPIFINSPRQKVNFLNSEGVTIDCSGHGYPEPVVSWIRETGENVAANNLLKLHNNGSLSIKPFSPEEFLAEVHSTVYRCKLQNKHGVILSIPVEVKSSINTEYALSRVYDEYVIKGNTGILKCHIPNFAKDDVKVTSWLKNNEKINFIESSKYFMAENGDLHVFHANFNDVDDEFKCKTKNVLGTSEQSSITFGKLHITDTRSGLPVSIAYLPKEVTVLVGKNFVVPCVAHGYPIPKYSWRKISTKNSTASKSMKMTKEGYLIINSADIENTSTYECEASNKIGSDRKRTKVLVIEDIQAYIVPERQILDIGNQLKITCSISGYPVEEINWFQNGLRILEQNKRILNFNETNESSIGSYQCFVKNRYQTVQASTSVLAGNFRPKIIYTSDNNLVKKGVDIKLECHAEGKPPPIISWQIDNKKEISERGSRRIVNKINFDGKVTSVFRLFNVKSEDDGDYKCIATNSIGKVEKSINIVIHGDPVVHPLENMTIADGSKASIRCFVAGYPIKDVTWTKDRRRGGQEVVSRNATLSITNVKLGTDNGKYTCTAINYIGKESSQSFWLNVAVPPVLSPTMPFENKIVGDSLMLMCVAQRGSQPMSISWLKDSQKINFDLGILSSKTSISAILQVKKVKVHHEGNYTCIANNSAGSASLNKEIVVHRPPHILTNSTKKWITAGKSVVLNCEVTGNPRPVIEWNKEKENLTRYQRFKTLTNGSLHIDKLRISDSGVYTCAAVNGIHPSAYVDFYLNVGESPKLDIYRKDTSKMVKFECSMRGLQLLDINWILERKKLESNTMHRIKNVKLSGKIVSTISIQNVKFVKMKELKCVGRNKFGTSQVLISSVNTDTDFEELRPKMDADYTVSSETNKLQSYFNEAPINRRTTENPFKQDAASSKEEKQKGKVTFLQILVASVTTAVIVLLFILLLVLIILWKRRSDKREEEIAHQSQLEMNKLSAEDDYRFNPYDERYGHLVQNSLKNCDLLSEQSYYSSITPYATFNPNEERISITLNNVDS